MDDNNENNGKNTCRVDCPVRATAEVIERKWATLIVRDLLSGKKRFSELERSLHPISAKILSDRLKDLESHGVVSRTVHATVPPTTEYELTALGLELKAVIVAMQQFGELMQSRGETAAQA